MDFTYMLERYFSHLAEYIRNYTFSEFWSDHLPVKMDISLLATWQSCCFPERMPWARICSLSIRETPSTNLSMAW